MRGGSPPATVQSVGRCVGSVGVRVRGGGDVTTAAQRRQIKIERAAAIVRMDEAREAARYAVAQNKCPQCGAPLRRNLALTGWWQCSQYGADGFRADSGKPSCSWQGFTQ